MYEKNNENQLISDLYLKENKSTIEIAKILGRKQPYIRKKLLKLGVKLRNRSEARVGKSLFQELNDKDWLYRSYIIEKKNQKEIAKIVGCSVDAVCSALKKFQINKTKTQAFLERYEKKPKISKYPLLNDRDWLYQKAIVEKLSYVKIAELVGTKGWELVRTYLQKFGIFERRRDRPHVVGKSSYEILNDKDWLYDQYIVKRKSTNEISRLCGNPNPSCQLVSQALRRHGIIVRTKSEGQEVLRDGYPICFNFETMCIINGGLLGDASIKNDKDKRYNYSKTSINKDYLQYEGFKLLNKDSNRFIIPRNMGDGFSEFKRNGVIKRYKNHQSYLFQTYFYKELSDIEKKWYIKEGQKRRKIIPEDFEMNNQTLLHWFLDDGYSYIVNKKYKTKNGIKKYKQIRVYFCTQSFRFKELEILCNRIKKQFGITLYIRYHQKHGVVAGTGYELEMSLPDVPKFFSIIGPCPVPSMQYKWKLD